MLSSRASATTYDPFSRNGSVGARAFRDIRRTSSPPSAITLYARVGASTSGGRKTNNRI